MTTYDLIMAIYKSDEVQPDIWYEDRPYGDGYTKEKMVEYRCKNPECGG